MFPTRGRNDGGSQILTLLGGGRGGLFTDDAEDEEKNDEDINKVVENDKAEYMNETDVKNEKNNENEKMVMEADDCFTMKKMGNRKGIVLILGNNKTIPLLLDRDKIRQNKGYIGHKVKF